MGVKVKPYNNVPSRLAGVRPKKKPVPETPAQRKKRERLTRGLGDVELRADLESYMRENPLAKLGYDVVTTGVSGEEDRQGITAFIADKTRLNIRGQASYDHPWGVLKSTLKDYKKLRQFGTVQHMIEEYTRKRKEKKVYIKFGKLEEELEEWTIVNMEKI